MTTNILSRIDQFVIHWCEFQQAHHHDLLIEQDPEWISPAEQGSANSDGEVIWGPALQPPSNNLQALVDGLEVTPNPELEAYFTRYFSDNLDAETERGRLQLLMPWNQDDFVRLQQNLIAHVMMKRRLRQQETLFFAVTDEEDFIISVLNQTGEVVLEQVGKEPKEVLAGSLSEFFTQLRPLPYRSVA
ncbi:SecY-interacting protein [Planctobacterium marinum]|uniref:Protein Syd n=1 Tax=Planctobacterium marinum TaxID=1631968 RepID=A0AA48KTK3_9ALTE|nr:protein Syd [Planctobacterium marinum]